MGSNTKTQSKNCLLTYLLSGAISIIVSLLLIILFAFCIKWFSLSDSLITPVNMAIKAVSIFVGMIFLVKDKSRGLVKGFTFGLLYSLIAFTLFSLLAGSFTLGIGLVLDILLCVSIGSIVGIVLVNIKR